jgi:MarR family transcriptional regulator, organic hydroperoxide resistance regulator
VLPLPLRIDHQLCVALYDASRAMTGCYRPLLEAIGLTYSQYVVMMVLWEHGSVTLGHLSAQVHLDSGTLSPLLKRLDGMGLLTRQRRPEDERTLQVTITDAGRALEARAVDVQRQVEESTGMGREELIALREQLRALTDRLRAA